MTDDPYFLIRKSELDEFCKEYLPISERAWKRICAIREACMQRAVPFNGELHFEAGRIIRTIEFAAPGHRKVTNHAPEGTDFTITLPNGVTIKAEDCVAVFSRENPRCDLPNPEAQALAFAASRVIDDIKRTVDIFDDLEPYNPPLKLDAMSVVIKTENIIALRDAVKAVFDE